MQKVVILVLLAVVCATAIDVQRARSLNKLRAATEVGNVGSREVIVTMSYMDEEAASVLSSVLKKTKKFSAIYVIERGASKKPTEFLFERPVKTYFKAEKKGVWIDAWESAAWKRKCIFKPAGGDGGEVRPADAFLDDLKEGIKTKLNSVDLQSTLKEEFLTTAKSKTCAKINDGNKECETFISTANIYSFGVLRTGKDSKDLPIAIVVRTLEMGMNMAIFEEYNRRVMQGIKAAVKAAKIQFYAIGASGAANAKDCVGKLHKLDSSVYVGVTVPEKNQAKPVISFDTLADGVAGTDKVLWSGDAGEQKAAPVKKAEKEYVGLKEGELKTKLAAAGKDKHPAMTAAYFMGLDTKKVSNDLGYHASNTEDYMMIRLINTMLSDTDKYPTLKHYAVFRADADPYAGDPEAAKKTAKPIQKWIEDNRCVPIASYVDALKWARDGMKTDEVLEGVCWDITIEGKKDNPAFFALGKVKGKDKKCALNPFMVEAATDLAKDVYTKFSCTGEYAFPKAVKKANKLTPSVSDEDILAFLKELKLDLEALSHKPCETPTNMPIWLRAGWDGYDPDFPKFYRYVTWMKFDDGGEDEAQWKPNAAGADRLLYKSSNFVVMDDLTKTLFHTSPFVSQYATGTKTFAKCDGLAAQQEHVKSFAVESDDD